MNAQKILVALLVLTGFVVTANATMLVQAAGYDALRTIIPAPASDVIPTGVPDIYGNELGVSFDDVSPADPQKADLTISKLAKLDRTITLSDAENERYVNALYTLHDGISCEYCCGARSIIFENGKAACGCAHSFAMRGLAKYLITEHGEKYTDEEILAEVGKWKTLFFPTQLELKASILKEQDIAVNYITLASNKHRGIEQGQTAGK